MRVAIIGGGPGGLTTAYLLRQRVALPLDVTLFESSERLGGKIVTARFERAPVSYEAGAAELYDYSQVGPDPLRELIHALGLSTQPLEGRGIVMDGQFLKCADDIRRHFGPRTLAVLEDFRERARELISPADYYESDWASGNVTGAAEQGHGPAWRSFHDLLDTVADESARRLLRVLVHSDLATEPHRTSAQYGLQNFLMNEPDYMRLYTIKGGIESLTRELAARLPDRVLLNHRVTRVAPTREQTYLVDSRHCGAVVSETFDVVVVALPNHWIPSIDWGGEALSAAMHAHHGHYDYPAHYLRVSLLFERPFWREEMQESYFMLDAFGGCCVYDETSRGAQHFNGGPGAEPYGVLGWLLAGDAALNLSNLPDCDLINQMLDSLPPFWQHAREILLEGRVHRWVGSVNGLPSGYPALEPDRRHVPDPEGIPRLLVVGDYLFDSTLNGVLDSAEVAVEWIKELVGETAESGTVSHAAP